MTSKSLTPVIGLEIHVQLKTKSKMFCACSNDGENQAPNTTVCSVCMGHPGTLPVANKEAIRWAAKTSLALGCAVPQITKFDRKNYFYPDLPKGYQISQFDQPVGPAGHLTIMTPEGEKTIRITRLHLEEDAAKNTHTPDGKHTLVDYNRSSTPLMEVVTEPDLRSAGDAKLLLQELRLIMRYLGVSDADMEKGHLRCDANVSLTDQPADNIVIEKLHPKTEVKNLNSFKAVERAIIYEIKRQTELWEAGTPPDMSSTRGWNEDKGITEAQRTKEASHDYRYFPEPDLPPVHFDLGDESLSIADLRRELPELPAQRRTRFASEYSLTSEQARTLVDDKNLADFFEQTMSELIGWVTSLDTQAGTEEEILERDGAKLAKLAYNWLVNKLLGIVYKDNHGKTLDEIVTPENFAEFIALLNQNKFNSTVGQKVLEQMVKTGDDPTAIVEQGDFGSATSTDDLATIIDGVIASNPKEVEQYRGGKTVLLQFFVGQVMKQTKGQADPGATAEILQQKLS
jgi:aspartyl-tRNA(Asn)/glutamyl-tRNA(Gln) amidotransferase subunit B